MRKPARAALHRMPEDGDEPARSGGTEPADAERSAAPRPEADAPRPDGARARRPAARARLQDRNPRRRGVSLIWRILALNVLTLAALAVGLMYLDRYREGLLDAELDSLTVQAQIVAEALGEAAVTSNFGEGQDYLTAMARPLVRRLAGPPDLRVRLFAANGDLIADSRSTLGVGGPVISLPLPPPPAPPGPLDWLVDAYEWAIELLPNKQQYMPYRESSPPVAFDYGEALGALRGETEANVRIAARGEPILLAAAPVSRYKQILGVVVLTKNGAEVEENLRRVRLDILQVVAVVLIATVLLSLYLANTIARPVRRLAAAAKRVGHGQGRHVAIPDFSRRGDEIGDLSAALREMTDALWTRMDAIERFAADVAHEIKNPLSSLRSAVETVSRIEDPMQQRKLVAIITDDVKRLDRLISDISDASRLDAELSRAESEPVDVAGLLAILAEIHEATAPADAPRLVFAAPPDGLVVLGIESRLVQVFRNLLSNAVSFSPPGGEIRLRAERDGVWVRIAVEDQGPGIPEEKREAIFNRFYTERPKGEKFGTHSGLGLSISQQIVQAHRGRIWAENIYDAATPTCGPVRGARFVVLLPVAPKSAAGRPAAKDQAAKARTKDQD